MTLYRFYEGFMTQLSISFVLSTCVTMDWKSSTTVLAFSYVYYFARMASKFDHIPHNLIVALIETTFFYGFGSYLSDRTLKNEFVANYKNKQTTKGTSYFTLS